MFQWYHSIIIQPKTIIKSQNVSIWEYNQICFVTPSDHCALHLITYLTRPSLAARCNGVISSSFLLSTSAPASIRVNAMQKYPFSQATCNDELSNLSHACNNPGTVRTSFSNTYVEIYKNLCYIRIILLASVTESSKFLWILLMKVKGLNFLAIFIESN